MYHCAEKETEKCQPATRENLTTAELHCSKNWFRYNDTSCDWRQCNFTPPNLHSERFVDSAQEGLIQLVKEEHQYKT